MAIGFDSFTVKLEHAQEAPWVPAIEHASLMEAALQEAECSVCRMPLGPVVFDVNHHVGWENEEIRDKVVHYCAVHCPACGGEHAA